MNMTSGQLMINNGQLMECCCEPPACDCNGLSALPISGSANVYFDVDDYMGIQDGTPCVEPQCTGLTVDNPTYVPIESPCEYHIQISRECSDEITMETVVEIWIRFLSQSCEWELEVQNSCGDNFAYFVGRISARDERGNLRECFGTYSKASGTCGVTEMVVGP